ncbi:putative RNA-directed DNA polymerase from transposon BS [Caerostris extrusa]|uniref:RNA-directed DNA polymerase from transposon BS n=1 Tax=Caerostris extrusa TaxID=172846 RepID=A0AAV4MWW4_CAEEX|nr:putative RNA-directed DNA polymerase from transposon BS [Caerostris extrusa]
MVSDSFQCGCYVEVDINKVKEEFVSSRLFPYCSWKVVDYVGSDHYPILIELDYDVKAYGNNNVYWNFKKANWTIFEKNLIEQLQKNLITEDLENEWFVFKHSIFTAAEGAVSRGKHKKTKPAFTNDSQDLQKLLAKREHLLQSHNLNDNTDARIELNKINAEIKREYCSIKQSNWQDLSSNEPITSSKLPYAIQQLDFKKSPGSDGIYGQFIVNLGSCATKRLLHIFNLSWKLGRLPKQWKTAIVVPIRKPNKDASCMGSYRPIALTCMTCKLMERIILRRITFHLMNRNMLPQEQYGFRKGHRAIDQILYFVQRVRDAHNMKPSRHTMAVFLDLTKAFDKVWKNKLLGKCFSEFDIKGRAFSWLSDFMKNRSFRVRYQNSLSEIFKTYQGIPQVSGPRHSVNPKLRRKPDYSVPMLLYHDKLDSHKTLNRMYYGTTKRVKFKSTVAFRVGSWWS